MDKFEAMQRFLLVAQTGSFTKAAELRDLPKSSISNAIQTLEAELGTRLFHRSTRRVTLTQDGARFLPQCQSLLDDMDSLVSQFQRSPTEVNGVLRIDMPSRFASSVVLPHLDSLLSQYPNLIIKVSSSDQRVDLIKESIDCVIRVGELEESGLIAKPLLQFHSWNCISQDYAQQYGIPQSLEALSQHKIIEYSHLLGDSQAEFEYCEKGQIRQKPMNSNIAVNGTEAYLSACLSGLGIAQIPALGIQSYIEQGKLIRILPEHEAAPMPVSLVYLSRKQKSKRLQVFTQWLQALLDKLQIDNVI
ncbi:LysR family transcriptional regulator [Vibrio sp. S11_S32]|uniref:LysR family transcriptional regulator n=1 Tax=Vibrio sp. S11_S32 TaxID=2720225 RepID=UPI0016804AD0|nr:LysR family transcriptional regulator [Vibrio sp. S11_S32]MBD1575916.1 LysR family transcriptional regulator [Vibrio sp. S11_S32]